MPEAPQTPASRAGRPRSPWIPRVLLGIVSLAILYAIVSIAIGQGGPKGPIIRGIDTVQQLYGGIPQEGAYLGPSDAPVTITVFTDLRCSQCADYQEDTVDPLVEAYARTGDAQLELRHLSINQEEETTLAAYAATAAGEQGHQWQYADLVLRNLRRAPGGSVDDRFLREVAETVPELDQQLWDDDRGSAQVNARVEDDLEVASSLRLPLEPSVVVSGPGGQRQLEGFPSRARIDAAVAAVS